MCFLPHKDSRMFVARSKVYAEASCNFNVLRLGVVIYMNNGVSRIQFAAGPFHVVVGYVHHRPSFRLLAHQSAHQSQERVS